MILYKYKSLENFDEVTDLLLTKRLYCPTPSELNDPLEGMLGVKSSDKLQSEDKLSGVFKFWEAHEKTINSYRICSFSANPDSMVMWSYYGAAHSGMCLELDVSEYEQWVHEVQYVSKMQDSDNPSTLYLLTHKFDAWSHEKEYRWISDENPNFKYIRAKIQTILLGAKGMKYLRPIMELCAVADIQIDIASFNTSGILSRIPLKKGIRWDEVDPIDPYSIFN